MKRKAGECYNATKTNNPRLPFNPKNQNLSSKKGA